LSQVPGSIPGRPTTKTLIRGGTLLPASCLEQVVARLRHNPHLRRHLPGHRPHCPPGGRRSDSCPAHHSQGTLQGPGQQAPGSGSPQDHATAGEPTRKNGAFRARWHATSSSATNAFDHVCALCGFDVLGSDLLPRPLPNLHVPEHLRASDLPTAASRAQRGKSL